MFFLHLTLLNLILSIVGTSLIGTLILSFLYFKCCKKNHPPREEKQNLEENTQQLIENQIDQILDNINIQIPSEITIPTLNSDQPSDQPSNPSNSHLISAGDYNPQLFLSLPHASETRTTASSGNQLSNSQESLQYQEFEHLPIPAENDPYGEMVASQSVIIKKADSISG